jgi:hypothetical protein
MEEFGCPYCWDEAHQKEKPELWFFDAANNYRPCEYCPKCGRKYGTLPSEEQKT